MKKIRTKEIYNQVAYEYKLHELTSDESNQLKQTLLEIAVDVNNVCKKYNLNLMMGYGTLLGSVRHQGFIPWDDDMDFLMSRVDYEKLIDVFNKELSEKYILQVPRIEPNACFGRMKIRKKNTIFLEYETEGLPIHKGIFIDIAPLDILPESTLSRIIHIIRFSFYRQITISTALYKYPSKKLNSMIRKNWKANLIMRTRIIIGRIFSFKTAGYWNNKTDKIAKQFMGLKSNYYSDIYKRNNRFSNYMNYSDIYPIIRMKFEDIEFNVPSNYKLILKKQYGDYMVIPDHDKRERHWVIEIKF